MKAILVSFLMAGREYCRRTEMGDVECVPKPDSEKADTADKTVIPLSKNVQESITNIIEAMKAQTAALETLLKAADSQRSEGKDSPSDEGAPKQRSIPTESQQIFNFKDWQFSREVLRAIVHPAAKRLSGSINLLGPKLAGNNNYGCKQLEDF